MRVPLSWLREYVDLPATETGRDVQAKLIEVGLEVETVEQLGAGLVDRLHLQPGPDQLVRHVPTGRAGRQVDVLTKP